MSVLLGAMLYDVFGVSPESWTAIGTLALAAVTVGVVFSDRLAAWAARPRLELDLRKHPPDTHQIALTDPRTGVLLGNGIYMRARITHRRGRAAQNAELMATALWRRNDDDTYSTVSSFLPMSLKWSHVGGTAIRVPHGLFRHCDVGHFVPDDDAGTILALDTVVQPNFVAGGDFPNILKPGVYVLELLLSSDDSRPIGQCWQIAFGPEWSEDESTMLARITAQPTKRP